VTARLRLCPHTDANPPVHPHHQHAQQQELQLPELTREAYAALGAAPQLTALTSLDGSYCSATDVQALAAAPWLTNLRALKLGLVSTDSSCLSFLAGMTLPHLHTLGLEHGWGPADDATHLSELAAWSLPALRVLNLWQCNVTSASVHSLVTAPWIPGLETLRLGRNSGVDDCCMAALCAAPLRSLRALDLFHTGITDQALTSLAQVASQPGHWVSTSLSRLDLGLNLSLLAESAPWAAFAAAPLRALRALGLMVLDLGREDAEALGAAPWLGGLEDLRLDPFDDQYQGNREALRRSPAFVRLEQAGKVQHLWAGLFD